MTIFSANRVVGFVGAGFLSGILLALFAIDAQAHTATAVHVHVGPDFAPWVYVAILLAIVGSFAGAVWSGGIADADLVDVERFSRKPNRFNRYQTD